MAFAIRAMTPLGSDMKGIWPVKTECW